MLVTHPQVTFCAEYPVQNRRPCHHITLQVGVPANKPCLWQPLGILPTFDLTSFFSLYGLLQGGEWVIQRQVLLPRYDHARGGLVHHGDR